jgi:hypothetical protein
MIIMYQGGIARYSPGVVNVGVNKYECSTTARLALPESQQSYNLANSRSLPRSTLLHKNTGAPCNQGYDAW